MNMIDGPAGQPAVDPAQVDLSLVVPCYNEAEVLRGTALQLVDSFRRARVNLELVLVDNGSHDATGSIIQDLRSEGLPVVPVTVAVNRGYGNGILQGVPHCKGRFVGFACADGQVDANDIVKLYDILARATVPKLVKVRRRFRMDGLVRKLVSIVYNCGTAVLFGGLGSIDINGNPKLLSREALERMHLETTDWFLDAEVMIKAKALGLQVFEMNVLAQMREGGSSHVRASTCWEFVVNLARFRFGSKRVLRNPSKLADQDRVPLQDPAR